jgi:hypothetical protein
MHAAPSVSYPVGRSGFAAALLAIPVLLALAAAGAWVLQAGAFGWRQALAVLAVLACAGVAAAGWRRSATGTLRWDGEHWQWQDRREPQPGALETALDLQSRILLRWHGAHGAGRWLWLERKSAPADWDALRRAVYSRASQQGPRADSPTPGDRAAER